ncbi:hypothetical protein [Streptomyces sp. 2A115]|uniref:hypothetical protein n=1 Tax=Streptomyces sp. 2A115 TaxID=3457439 RepID=UPI003FCF1757
MLSKLVDNAVQHSDTYTGDKIRVRVFILRTNELLLEVSDKRKDFPNFHEAISWEPDLNGRPRGLWWARYFGARISYGPATDNDGGTLPGKSVTALLPPTQAVPE